MGYIESLSVLCRDCWIGVLWCVCIGNCHIVVVVVIIIIIIIITTTTTVIHYNDQVLYMEIVWLVPYHV
jgi:hypothetical protein